MDWVKEHELGLDAVGKLRKAHIDNLLMGIPNRSSTRIKMEYNDKFLKIWKEQK